MAARKKSAQKKASRPSRKAAAGGRARERGRERPMVTVTMSPEAIDMLAQLADARGMSRSATVEYLVREEGIRMRLQPKARDPRARRWKP